MRPCASAKTKLEATYTTATALHMQMEPVNCLALEKDGGLGDSHGQPVAIAGAALALQGAGDSPKTRS